MHIKREQKITLIMQMMRVMWPTDISCQRELLFVEYKSVPPLESLPLTQVKNRDALLQVPARPWTGVCTAPFLAHELGDTKLHEATAGPPLCLQSV